MEDLPLSIGIVDDDEITEINNLIKGFEMDEVDDKSEEPNELQQSFKDIEDYFDRRRQTMEKVYLDIEERKTPSKPKSSLAIREESKVQEIEDEEGEIEELTEQFWNDIQSFISELSNSCLAAALEDSEDNVISVNSKKRKSYESMKVVQEVYDDVLSQDSNASMKSSKRRLI